MQQPRLPSVYKDLREEHAVDNVDLMRRYARRAREEGFDTVAQRFDLCVEELSNVRRENVRLLSLKAAGR